MTFYWFLPELAIRIRLFVFILKESLLNSTERIKCTEWEYDMTDKLGNTWTSEWDLVCDSEYLKNVAEMFFLVGVATGGIISGYLSDKFGRRTMLFWSVIFQTIFGKYRGSAFFLANEMLYQYINYMKFILNN